MGFKVGDCRRIYSRDRESLGDYCGLASHARRGEAQLRTGVKLAGAASDRAAARSRGI